MALWTPAEITTALWLDAADADTITLNGSNVSQWNDKSGNARHVSQSTSGNQPLYDSTDDFVDFGASTAYLFNTSPFLHDSGQISLFSVMDAVAASDTRWVSEGSSTSNTPLYIMSQCQNSGAVADGTWFIRDDGNSDLLSHTGYRLVGMFAAGKHINFSQDDNGDVTLGRNGVMGTTVSYTLGTLTLNRFSIGGILRSSFSNAMNFKLHEVVAVAGALTLDTRQTIEGYLAHRWGLEANLPAEHPYKAAAPTPETPTPETPTGLIVAFTTANSITWGWDG